MSLRIRLNFLITLLFVTLFIFSSFYIIANARKAVQDEVEATAHLALQLIQIAFSSASLDSAEQMQLLDKIAALDVTRHLYIDIYDANAEVHPIDELATLDEAEAPTWFVKLVQPPPTEIRHWLDNPDILSTGIIIRADPVDEINENWVDVRGMLIFLFAFIVLANILVYLTIGKYLAPIAYFHQEFFLIH